MRGPFISPLIVMPLMSARSCKIWVRSELFASTVSLPLFKLTVAGRVDISEGDCSSGLFRPGLSVKCLGRVVECVRAECAACLVVRTSESVGNRRGSCVACAQQKDAAQVKTAQQVQIAVLHFAKSVSPMRKNISDNPLDAPAQNAA